MGCTSSTFHYGTHETLVLNEDSVAEAEAHQSACEKPHERYIPVREFTIEHLPVKYREPDLFELIKTMAGLTVRILVNYQSHERIYGNGVSCSDPVLDNRRSSGHGEYLGSGRIADVYQDEKLTIDCRCEKCIQSTVKRETWIILVFTATHVVFDTAAAEKSTCFLFSDNDKRGRTKFHGVRRRWSSVDGDLCILECATCDENLARELIGKICGFNTLWERIALKWSEEKFKTKHRLVAIVSHPHGLEKKISVGILKNIEKRLVNERDGLCLHYDVSTCSGSSGAPVYVYGQDWFKIEYVHSGRLPSSNYSTIWCRNEGLVQTSTTSSLCLGFT